VKVIECKQVDEWDGGDRQNFGFYISADVPNEDIEKARPHCYIQKKTIVVFDSLQELADHGVYKLRRAAWAKLTPLERQAIGMQDPN
jgi:hypothetical protein